MSLVLTFFDSTPFQSVIGWLKCKVARWGNNEFLSVRGIERHVPHNFLFYLLSVRDIGVSVKKRRYNRNDFSVQVKRTLPFMNNLHKCICLSVAPPFHFINVLELL